MGMRDGRVMRESASVCGCQGDAGGERTWECHADVVVADL